MKKKWMVLLCYIGLVSQLLASTALEIVNGASGYIESPKNFTGDTFTSIMWVKMNPTSGSNGQLFALGSVSTNANTAFWVNNSGRLTFYNKWPEGYAINEGLMTPYFNQWTHLAFVGVTGQGVKVYINGSLAWTVTDTKATAVAQSIAANGFVTLGRNLDGGEPLNDTEYDELSVWSKAFSDAEILANYNNGNGAEFTGSEANLELYWKFDNGAGSSVVTDSSQQSRNGAIAGTEGTDYNWLAGGALTSPTEVVYDDFENGYAKWTISGTAFGAAPVNTAITNSSGFYASSGADSSATGSLTSGTFTIDKDFINFKITGGAEPSQGIRLVIGGSPVITWSGNVGWANWSVSNFILKSWDVQAYKGQTAHLEIFDNGTDAKDWIAVDNITFSEDAKQTGPVYNVNQPSYMEWFYSKRMADFAANDSSVPAGSTILLGDSITEVLPMGSAPARWKMVNRGIQGDCVGGWNYLGLYDRLQESVYQHSPKNVFIAIGINDIVKWYPESTNAPIDDLENGYRKIVEGIQANSPQTEIYLQTVLPTAHGYVQYNDEVVEVNQRILKVANEKGVNFIDTHSDFKNGSGEMTASYTTDGIHLNSAGYTIWDQALTKALDGQEEKVYQNQSKLITLEGYDSKTFETPSTPSNGSLVLDPSFSTNGKVTYTPNADYTGDDSFTYTVAGDTRPFTVYIEVAPTTNYLTYIIAGQSNAQGYGQSSLLPTLAPNIATETAGVEILAARDEAYADYSAFTTALNTSVWTSIVSSGQEANVQLGADPCPVNNGVNGGVRTNAGPYTFGPELGIARTLKTLNPQENIRIIKFSKGGSAFSEWDPANAGVNLYDKLVDMVNRANAIAATNGETLEFKGLFWLQGESDSTNALAPGYGAKVSTLINSLRTDVSASTSDFKVVLSEIKDSQITGSGTWYPGGSSVENGRYENEDELNNQIKNNITSGNTAVTSASDMTFRGDVAGQHGATANGECAGYDGFHYNSADYLTLGGRMATEMFLTDDVTLINPGFELAPTVAANGSDHTSEITGWVATEVNAYDIAIAGKTFTETTYGSAGIEGQQCAWLNSINGGNTATLTQVSNKTFTSEKTYSFSVDLAASNNTNADSSATIQILDEQNTVLASQNAVLTSGGSDFAELTVAYNATGTENSKVKVAIATAYSGAGVVFADNAQLQITDTPIVLVNPGFEESTFVDRHGYGYDHLSAIPGWTIQENGSTFDVALANSTFTAANGASGLEGNLCAWINQLTNHPTNLVSLSQVSGLDFDVGETYNFLMDVASTSNMTGTFTAKVEILNESDVVLASVSKDLTSADVVFSTLTVSYKAISSDSGKVKVRVSTTNNPAGQAVILVDNAKLEKGVLTPAIGLEVSQTDTELLWTVEDEIGVKEYHIINAETKEVIETVLAVNAEVYTVTIPGGVKVELVVVDNNGYKQTYKPANGNEKVTVYDLVKGWNLLAVTSDNANLGTLKNETVGVIWGWNGKSYELIDSAEATNAIWVYSPIAKSVTVTGTKSTATINLAAGWNMVGPVENDYIPDDADTVFSWNDTYDIIAGDHKVLIEGKGYWIFSL